MYFYTIYNFLTKKKKKNVLENIFERYNGNLFEPKQFKFVWKTLCTHWNFNKLNFVL